jgi:hypothetical protein
MHSLHVTHQSERCGFRSAHFDVCRLRCRHVTAANVHTFMVIDRSKFMATANVTPDNAAIRLHPNFDGLDNQLGVVYEAVSSTRANAGRARLRTSSPSFLSTTRRRWSLQRGRSRMCTSC